MPRDSNGQSRQLVNEDDVHDEHRNFSYGRPLDYPRETPRKGSRYRSRSPRLSATTSRYDARRSTSRERRRSLDREDLPSDRSHTRDMQDNRSRRRSRSNSTENRRRRFNKRNRSRSPKVSSFREKNPLPSQQTAFNKELSESDPAAIVVKQRPNFGVSGKLAADSNTVAGTDVVLKYNEPPEARKPPSSQAWRLFIFKHSETLDEIELRNRSCWLFGREKAVVDYYLENPSCSKQHAVLQFRFVEKRNEFGDKVGRVKPYLIDLESANGSKVNGEEIPDRRFVELKSGDVISFGESTREYVLILP